MKLKEFGPPGGPVQILLCRSATDGVKCGNRSINNSRKLGNSPINGVKRCGSRDLLVVMNDSSAAESMADLVQSMEGAEKVSTMVGQLYQFLYREVFTVCMLLNIR